MFVGKILLFPPTLQLLTVSFCSTAYSIKLFCYLSPSCFLRQNQNAVSLFRFENVFLTFLSEHAMSFSKGVKLPARFQSLSTNVSSLPRQMCCFSQQKLNPGSALYKHVGVTAVHVAPCIAGHTGCMQQRQLHAPVEHWRNDRCL